MSITWQKTDRRTRTHVWSRLAIWSVNAAIYLRYPRTIRKFRRKTGYFPNPAQPRRYHEKMLWRKVFDRNPLLTTLSDKVAVKDWLARQHPDVAVARLIWAGTDPRDIPAQTLARGGFFKANHSSGDVLEVPPGQTNADRLAALGKTWLARDYSQRHAEWGYRDIPRRLLLEEAIVPTGKTRLYDYKFSICDGKVVTAWVATRENLESVDGWYLDPQGRELAIRSDWAVEGTPLDLHPRFNEMRDLAERLSKGLDHVRIDFTATADRYFFAEFTFYPLGGYDYPSREELPVGDQMSAGWDVTKSWFCRQPHRGWRRWYVEALKQLA